MIELGLRTRSVQAPRKDGARLYLAAGTPAVAITEQDRHRKYVEWAGILFSPWYVEPRRNHPLYYYFQQYGRPEFTEIYRAMQYGGLDPTEAWNTILREIPPEEAPRLPNGDHPFEVWDWTPGDKQTLCIVKAALDVPDNPEDQALFKQTLTAKDSTIEQSGMLGRAANIVKGFFTEVPNDNATVVGCKFQWPFWEHVDQPTYLRLRDPHVIVEPLSAVAELVDVQGVDDEH